MVTRDEPHPRKASAKFGSSLAACEKRAMASSQFSSFRAISPRMYAAPALVGSISSSFRNSCFASSAEAASASGRESNKRPRRKCRPGAFGCFSIKSSYSRSASPHFSWSSSASAFNLCAATESGANRPKSCAAREERSEWACTTTKRTSGSLGNTLCSCRRKSTLASRSSNARAQRKPTSPACFRVSLEPVPLNALFSVGRASLQRPCCARAMAFSVATGGAVFAARALFVCAKSGKLAQNSTTARRASAILKEYLSMSSQRRAQTNRRTVFTQNKNEAGGGERLPHYTWFVLRRGVLAQTERFLEAVRR